MMNTQCNNSNSSDTVSKIHNETNTRVYDRNIPSQVLQPYLGARPVMTKYSRLPVVDPRKSVTVPLMQLPDYNSRTVFNPGNTKSPWSGFASNVNVESDLRNQIYAIQKCSQAAYVPSSNSDLYQYGFTPQQQQVGAAHSLLFSETHFDNFNPNPDNKIVGSGVFYNSTRTQVKELGDVKPHC